MNNSFLEHTNVTVKDPNASAELLCRLFDWKIRWQGAAMDDGHTVHVGSDQSYIALYTQPSVANVAVDSYAAAGQLNHLGIVVDDLGLVEKRVVDAGLKITSRADYEPGRRFYFDTPDGIEIEVVSYEN